MTRTAILLAVLSLAGAQGAAGEPAQATPATPPKADAKAKPKEKPEELRWGLHFGLALPTTKTFRYYSDKGIGFVLGGQATWDVALEKRLRARLDYTAFPKVTVASQSLVSSAEGNTITGLSAGLEYLYFWAGRPQDFYSVLGVSLSHWSQDASTTGSKSKTSPGLSLGGGWQFTKAFGLEARATWSRWETNQEPRTVHNAGTVNLEASYRF